MKYTIVPANKAPKQLTVYARPQTLSEHELAFLAANNKRGFEKETLVVESTPIPTLQELLEQYPMVYVTTQDQRLEAAAIMRKMIRDDLIYKERYKNIVRRHLFATRQVVSYQSFTSVHRVPWAFHAEYTKQLSTLRIGCSH